MALSEHDRLRRAELATILHMCNPEVPIARAAAMIDRFYDLELAFVELFDIPRYMIGARRGLDMAIMHKWGDRPPPPIAPVLAEDLPASRQRDLLGARDPDAPNYRPRWSVGLSLDPIVTPRDRLIDEALHREPSPHAAPAPGLQPAIGDRAPCEICGLPSTYNGAAWVHDPPAPPPGAKSTCATCRTMIFFSGAVWWHAGGAPRDAHMPAPAGGVWWEE